MTQTITLTSKAVENAKRQLTKRGTPDAFLRVGLKGGGCSGWSFSLEYSDDKRERDIQFEFDGLKVIIDPKSLLYLDKTVVDYKVGLMNAGYEFQSPKAVSKCGCGSSIEFDIDKVKGT